MAYFYFNPFGNESIVLKFDCDNCGNEVISEEINIPPPDYTAETSSDSQNEEEGYAICETCDKEYEISIYVTFSGGDGHVEDLPESFHVFVTENSEPYYEDEYEAISGNTSFYENFKSEIENLKELNELKVDKLSIENTLKRQLFIGVIGCMETYLSDALINTTLSSTKFIMQFVNSSKGSGGETIPFDEFFENLDKIESKCKKAMLNENYHNLKKVKRMYKQALDIDIGEIEIPNKAVITRHHLVHRNGKTKEDVEVVINKETIENLINEISQFIENIENKIES